MNIIRTNCPECESALEFPEDFENIICPDCGTAFLVRQYKGVINLSRKDQIAGQSSPIGMHESEALAVVESRLAELDEMILEAGSEVEALKSREQSGPLQTGCSFFGLFMLAITVIIIFMPLGRKYFGNWLFYLALAVVILLGLRKIRRRQANPSQIEHLRRERLELEEGLARLEAERTRLLDLRSKVDSFNQTADAENSDR